MNLRPEWSNPWEKIPIQWKYKAMPNSKHFGPVLPNKGIHTPDEKLRNAQEDIVNGIENSDVALVKKSIKIAGPSLDTQALIRLNIRKTNKDKEKEHVEILRLILKENKERKNPQEIDCLEDALAWRKIKQFQIIAKEMKSMGCKDADIGPAIDKIVSQGEKELFDIILNSGLYNKEWATANLVTAYLSNGTEMIKTLVNLGADPTLDGSHEILKALDSRAQRYPSQDADNKILSLVSFYKLEDILSIPKELKDKFQVFTINSLNKQKNMFVRKLLNKNLKESKNTLEI